jgi:hypothetical protein
LEAALTAVLFFKRKYWSTWPDGVYWEVYVYEPVDMVWEPRTASAEICPARVYFPEKAREVPLAQLGTSIVEWDVPLSGPFKEVSCCNAKTYAQWYEANCSEERLKTLSANPDVTLCIYAPPPAPPAPPAPPTPPPPPPPKKAWWPILLFAGVSVTLIAVGEYKRRKGR